MREAFLAGKCDWKERRRVQRDQALKLRDKNEVIVLFFYL